MSSRRTAKLIFYRDLSKVFICTQKIIIYMILIYGVTGANKLKRYPTSFC
jgi:hypothetical protein